MIADTWRRPSAYLLLFASLKWLPGKADGQDLQDTTVNLSSSFSSRLSSFPSRSSPDLGYNRLCVCALALGRLVAELRRGSKQKRTNRTSLSSGHPVFLLCALQSDGNWLLLLSSPLRCSPSGEIGVALSRHPIICTARAPFPQSRRVPSVPLPGAKEPVECGGRAG